MKTILLLSLIIGLNANALQCNPDYIEQKNNEVRLDKNEKSEQLSLNKLLNNNELSVNDGDFVVIQNIAAGSDSINLDPKISSPDYTQNYLKNIEKMEGMLTKNEADLPSFVKKEDVLKIQRSMKEAIKSFTKNASVAKDWNMFNSFLYYNGIRFEQKYKFTDNCKMSLHELGAIVAYTGGLYKYINKSLRSDLNLNSLSNLVKIFNSGLEKLKPYTGTVIRGSNLSEPYLSQHGVGNTVLYKGLTSTSSGVSFAADYKFTIKSEQGRDISEISLYPDEKEIIFKPNSRFHIDNKVDSEFMMSEVVN